MTPTSHSKARTAGRPDARMFWLLREIQGRRYKGFAVAWDEEMVDAFVLEFPEAEATLRIYTLGPNSSPMLNAAASRARDKGFLDAGHIGNQDARSFNQRTWCRTWTITPDGLAALASLPAPQVR